jgi:hypothetical protein
MATKQNGSDNEGGSQIAHRHIEELRGPPVVQAVSADGAVNTVPTVPVLAPAPVSMRMPVSGPVSASVSVPVRVPSTVRAPVSASASMLIPASMTQSEFKIQVPSSSAPASAPASASASASAPAPGPALRPIVNNDNFIRCNMKNRGGSSKACRPTSSLAAKMKRRKSIGERRELSREHDRKNAMVNAESSVHGRQNSYTDSRQNSYTVGSTGSHGGPRQGGSDNQGEGQVRLCI